MSEKNVSHKRHITRVILFTVNNIIIINLQTVTFPLGSMRLLIIQLTDKQKIITQKSRI